jgi:hypothetical protein
MKNSNIFIVCILVVIIFGGMYFFMRNNCVSRVNYINAVAVGTAFEKPAHYTLSGLKGIFSSLKEFRTQNEAVSYCMSKKISFDD